MVGLQQLDDSSITVLEFFKLFNIDFVIHNPRQSVLPGRVSITLSLIYVIKRKSTKMLYCDCWLCFLQLLSETDTTAMDSLKDRHISRPKQMVYESDVLTLTEKVEGYVRFRSYHLQ